MFKTIVWATDGSKAADDALPYAKELAAKHGAALLALHVEETFATHVAAGLPLRADEADLKGKIERQVSDLAGEGIDAQLKVLSARGPHAAHVIADAAREAKADVIVAGTRGHTHLPGLALGSVTHRLLQVASCPVLSVPSGKSEHDEGAGAAAATTA